jgi:hypothetical protein
MPHKYRIVFNMPGQGDTKFYYRRASEATPDIMQAHHFHNADSVIAFRDRFRDEYKQCKVFIEDAQANILFERDAPPPNEPQDNRADRFVIPDAFESSGRGFIVRAAVTPSLGRCWAMRAIDVPSLSGRNIETIYSNDPLEAVERARLLWAPLIQPLEHPLKEQRDTIEAKKILKEIEAIKQGPGRRRPGND